MKLVFADVFSFFIIFARLGGAVMVMPVLGETIVSAHFRVLIALAIAFVLTPVLGALIPPQPESIWALLSLLVREIMVGLFVGLIARVILALLDVAGGIVSFQMNLSNAQIFNPAMGHQTALVGSFLGLGGLLILITLDLHHHMLRGLVASYDLFPPQKPLIFGDLSSSMVYAVHQMFQMGIQLSIPILIVSVIAQTVMGLLNRLMPQLQVFFLAMPAFVGLGLLVLMVTMAGMLLVFGEQFPQIFDVIFQGEAHG